MESKAQLFGHPIHPMLVTIPIGLFTTSLVCDIIYATGDRSVFWYDMAFWAMAFGIIGALVAAIPGLIDYGAKVRHSAHAAATARVHMIINLVVVGVYCLNLAMRYDYNAASGPWFGAAVALSVLSMLALGVSGWLGGELVYRHGIGLSKDTVRITRMDEVEQEARR